MEIDKQLVILSFACLLISTRAEELIERNTQYGAVRGYSVDLVPNDADDTRMLDAFTGIPFAEPPIGDLRWEFPEAPQPWEDVLNTTAFGPCCPQVLYWIRDWSFGPDFDNVDEDCLYLNVFAPREQHVETPAPVYPVMVFVHGGGNTAGCAEEYDSRIIPRSDIVVVTINYRLGAMGFFTTLDDVAPGNYALHDIAFALQWVKDNIASFGGNPSHVTVVGSSSGATFASLMMYSLLTEGLFERVVEQSGSATNNGGVFEPPLSSEPNNRYLARKFNCSEQSSQELVDCLRQYPAQDIVETVIVTPDEDFIMWSPHVDGIFLTGWPLDQLSVGDFHKVDLLTGSNTNECVAVYAGDGVGWTREYKEEQMYDFSRRFDEAADRVYDAMLQEYDLPGDNRQEQRDLGIEFCGDYFFAGGSEQQVQGQSQYVNNSYLYAFNYRSDNHSLPEWMGVPHFEEAYYTFGVPYWEEASACPWTCNNIVWYDYIPWTEQDRAMADSMMQAWANFVKTGNPSNDIFDWPAFSQSEERYAELGDPWRSEQYYKYSRMQWNTVYFRKLLVPNNCTSDFE